MKIKKASKCYSFNKYINIYIIVYTYPVVPVVILGGDAANHNLLYTSITTVIFKK